MGTMNVFASVKNDITRYGSQFAEGRARLRWLAPYETTDAVLSALAPASPLSESHRGALVAGLVSEEQRASHMLWQGLLLVAFEPMLRRLRTQKGRTENEDLDQDVLCGFFEAVCSFEAPVAALHTPGALLLATEAAVRAGVQVAGEGAVTDAFDKETEGWDPSGRGAEQPRVDGAVAELTRMLAANDGGDQGPLRAVFATCVGDETLTEYVARTHRSLNDQEQALLCGRLSRERALALTRLQVRFAAHRSAA